MNEGKKRRVVFVTGTRAEYDILYPVIKLAKESPFLKEAIIVTGMHLSPLYGNTVHEIEKDGFEVAGRVENLLNTDSLSGRVKSAGMQLIGLAQALQRLSPDFLVVVGDREESITTALAGAYMNIPVAHLCGGDRSWGIVDDSVRHAVTKLAHLHFPSNEESAERIIKLGEEPWRVFTTGDPGLDRFFKTPVLSRSALSERLGISLEPPVLLLIQHSVGMEVDSAACQMEETMEAVKELGHTTLVSYPNSDPGGQKIIEVIERYDAELPFVKVYKSLPREDFVSLMKVADVIVGNSSCGILEAPLIKLPAVNVGSRQGKRLCAENVIFAGHDRRQIVAAIRKALYDEEFRKAVRNCKSPYGDGHAGERIIEVLTKTEINHKLLNKDLTF